MNKKDLNIDSVAGRIRDIRKRLGFSMEEFASRIDDRAKSGTVSNWETGKNLPNNKRLTKIAELGNLTVDELLYGSYENVVRELINEADYFANSGEFNELELDPNGLKDTLKEISSFYWRYYIQVANEKSGNTDPQKEIESVLSAISSKCKNQGVSMTDYRRIIQCIHSYFEDNIFPDSYSNKGFIDYTIDHLMNVSNEKIINYLELANKHNVSIDSDLYNSTFNIISESMNKINRLKKDLPK